MSQQQQSQPKATGRRRGLSGYLDEVAAGQETSKGTKKTASGGASKMAKKEKEELSREQARQILNSEIEGLQIVFGTMNNNPSDAFMEQFLTNEKLVTETGIDSEWFDTVKRLMYRSLESACGDKEVAELEKYNEEDWVKLITSMTMQQVALAESISGTLNDKTKEIIRQAVVSYVKDDSFKQDMLELLLSAKEARDSVMEEVTKAKSEPEDNVPDDQVGAVVHLVTQNKAVDLETNTTYESKGVPVSITYGDQPDDDGVRKIITDAIRTRVNAGDYRNYKLNDWMNIIADISLEFIKNDPKLSNEIDADLFKSLITSVIGHKEIREEIEGMIAEITKEEAKTAPPTPNAINTSVMASVIRRVFIDKSTVKKSFESVMDEQIVMKSDTVSVTERMRKAFASV